MTRPIVGTAATVADSGEGAPRTFRPFFVPLWIGFVASQWWIEIASQIANVVPSDGPQIPTHLAGAMGAIGHLVCNAVEALFYLMWWRMRGTRLGFARLFEGLVSISVLDLVAAGLARLGESHPGWIASALEIFVGFGAIRGDEPVTGSGLRVAFGSLGLLCVARLFATAAIQRQGTHRGLAAPFALTVAVWLVCRVFLWWSIDLLRGISPLS